VAKLLQQQQLGMVLWDFPWKSRDHFDLNVWAKPEALLLEHLIAEIVLNETFPFLEEDPEAPGGR
jgi:hypothetical protein